MTATVHDISAALRGAGVADVLSDDTHRAAYSSDASLYRVVPRAVVRPRHEDEIEATLGVCRALGGAGHAARCWHVHRRQRGRFRRGAGLSRNLNRVLAVDPDSRTGRVQAGTVHATLQAAARPLGLRCGPIRPATPVAPSAE